MFFIFVFCVFEVLYFSKVFSWVDRCARQESCHSSQLIDLFMVETNTDHTFFYMITKLYKEYPCIFGIQFMLDNVEAFFAGDQPQQHCVTHFFFWKIQLLCIFVELFIGLEFSCRPISASFLIRTSGKEYHSQAGSTSLMKKLACPGYEVHLSKGHFHTFIIRPVSCLVSWHLPSSPNDGV